MVGSSLVTYYMKNPRGMIRIGITTSKKIGGAVERNRARRVIREAFRLLSPEIHGGCDLIFVVRVKTAKVKMPSVMWDMRKHLQDAGLLSS